MNKIKTYFILLLSLVFTTTSIAQKKEGDEAYEHFKFGNYIDAIKIYSKLIEKDPKNIDYPYNAGLCILFTDNGKSDAIKYLEKAVQFKSNVDAEFYLGMAYHYNLKLDKALTTYNNYKEAGKGTKVEEVDRQIQLIKNSQKLIISPINVSFENLGEKINTEYPDYYSFVTPNESFMVFTSRRKNGVKEFDGYYPSSIYSSKVINGEFVKAKKGSPLVNSTYDDQVVGLSYNADKLFIYFDDIKNTGDIYEADIVDFKFKKKVKMGIAVNSKGFESSATVSADGNTLFFASIRNEGLGGKDIYMTRKLPTGEWALPQNLGSNINTKYDEDFPNLFYDGTTLYFSSKGRNSMGGYDYFKSTWNPNTNEWSKAENLGYPLNNARDNVCISFTEDQRHAYISSWRKDSKGFQDIYKVTFNEISRRETIIKANIISSTTNDIIKDAFVVIENNLTKEERNYTPNSINGGIIIALPQGNYTITITATGYQFPPENITIAGRSNFITSMSKQFIVTP
mgnify:CR=1 FL=1